MKYGHMYLPFLPSTFLPVFRTYNIALLFFLYLFIFINSDSCFPTCMSMGSPTGTWDKLLVSTSSIENESSPLQELRMGNSSSVWGTEPVDPLFHLA